VSRALVGSIGVLLTLSLGATAQERPNFAGRWVLVSPTDSAGQEQTVTQDTAQLTTSHASEGGGHRTVYRLDGVENRTVLGSHGSDIVTLSTASWNGNRLTIASNSTYPDGRKRHTTHVWSLDGKDRLVIEFTESGSSASPRTTTLVYARR
jgi:hypothetical protein